eukprot:g36121.t1
MLSNDLLDVDADGMVGEGKGNPIAVAGRKRSGEGRSAGDGSDLVEGPVNNGAGESLVEEEGGHFGGFLVEEVLHLPLHPRLTCIPDPKKTFHIRQMFTCTPANVVYCIRCSRCGLLYVGETKRRLGHCFVEHLHSVHDKQQHLPVTNHFNSPFHSLDDLSILGLLQCHNDATRKLEEQHFIFLLGIRQPNGLNVDFT